MHWSPPLSRLRSKLSSLLGIHMESIVLTTWSPILGGVTLNSYISDKLKINLWFRIGNFSHRKWINNPSPGLSDVLPFDGWIFLTSSYFSNDFFSIRNSPMIYQRSPTRNHQCPHILYSIYCICTQHDSFYFLSWDLKTIKPSNYFCEY